MQSVKIYTTGSCPYCIHAKQLLKHCGCCAPCALHFIPKSWIS